MIEIEIFKTIPDFSDYMISNFGILKSMKYGNEYVLKQCESGEGYLQVDLCKNGIKKPLRIHVLMMIVFKNHIPDGNKFVIDHKNGIKTDNRLENLQIISHRKNCSKDKKGFSSKYIGVSWNKKNKKWSSKIRINGKQKFLGLFDDEIKASQEYKKELKKI